MSCCQYDSIYFLKITSIPLKLTGWINIKRIFWKVLGDRDEPKEKESRAGGRGTGMKWHREGKVSD